MAEFLTDSVKTAYDQFYTNDQTAWRMLGAKYKAQNITDVCQSIKPAKVFLVYSIKKSLGNLLGKKKQEQFANAYTVLTIF